MTTRRGFSLIEVLIAMTILSIALMSLAKLSAVITIKTRTNDLVAKRTAALQREANKLGIVRFDSLANWPTANKSFTFGTFTYTRRLTITSQSSTRYTIKVVVVPSSDTTKPDSVTFDRTKPSSSALCTGC